MGRRPGSKNNPQITHAEATVANEDVQTEYREPKRRGRPKKTLSNNPHTIPKYGTERPLSDNSKCNDGHPHGGEPCNNPKGHKGKHDNLSATPQTPSSENTQQDLVLLNPVTGEIVGPAKVLDLRVSARAHYSHSFLKSVAQCSAQAKFKAEHAPQRKAFSLERGSCVHHLLELFAKEGKDPVAGLPEAWRFYITDHVTEMNEADREKAAKEYDNTKRMLEEFVYENKQLFKERVRPEDIEVEFNLDVPLRLGDKTFTRKFNGKIDLVLWSDDRTKYRIIDYKTSASAPDPNSLALDAQFSLYFWAGEQLYGKKASALDYYLLNGVHICHDEEGKSIRFSSKAHPREIGQRKSGCEITYALKVPKKSDEEIEELFNAYYAPLVVKYESGIVAKEGRADVRNRCNLCTFFEYCATVREFPAPRII